MSGPPRRLRLVVSLPYGMSARNVLRSSALPALRAAADLVVVTPLARDRAFVEEYAGPGIRIEEPAPIPIATKALLKVLRDAETLRWMRDKRVGTWLLIERVIAAGVADPILRSHTGVFSPLSRTVAAREPVRRLVWSAIRAAHRLTDPYASRIREWAPDAVLLTHPYIWYERHLALSLERARIPTAALIHSWDNVTGHPKVTARFDRVIVWSDTLRRQMEELYDYGTDRVVVSGVPQMDAYVDPSLVRERDAFLRGAGIDPSRRVVTYACGAPAFVPDQHRIVEVLARAVAEDRLAAPATLVIRLHPGLAMPEVRALASLPNVRIDEPSTGYVPNLRESGWVRGGGDVEHFVNLITHSDVVVNAFSTTTLDAAALDRPVVGIGFDADGPRPYLESLAKHYDFDHYRPVVASGGLQVARSPEELLRLVDRYLADPAADREGRLRIVREQCFRLDGRSGERIAQAVIDLARRAA